MAMRTTLFSALTLVTVATSAVAQSWNFATYRVGDNQKIVAYTGSMVAPTLPRAGVYYLWPGLQPADDSGIFQPVLDGRSGGWWFGMGWCCSNPSLAWGGGFPVEANTVLGFNWTLVDSESIWKTTITNGMTGQVVDGEFPLGQLQPRLAPNGRVPHESLCSLSAADKRFNQAVLAIERYDVEWDFGPLEFRDIKIVSIVHSISVIRC